MERVCCMCGDVGFSDKLFRCGHCRNRFQHSSYYSEIAEPSEICDWCQSQDKKLKSVGTCSSSKKKTSGGGIKHHHDQVAKSVSGVPSTPRTSTRRYKLLKDVMC